MGGLNGKVSYSVASVPNSTCGVLQIRCLDVIAVPPPEASSGVKGMSMLKVLGLDGCPLQYASLMVYRFLNLPRPTDVEHDRRVSFSRGAWLFVSAFSFCNFGR